MSKILSFTTVNKRENNEDSCLAYTLNIYSEGFTVLLLSDGMGGHDYGEVISNTVIANMSMIISNRILKNFIYPKNADTNDFDFKKLLYSATELTNHKILQLITNNKWKGGGATIVSVIIHKNKFYWAVLGDSRLYHFHKNENKLVQIGFDHSVPGILLHEKAITPEIAKHHAQRNQLVYFMGIEKFPTLNNLPFIGESELQTDDMLLLFSDGLTGKVEDTYIHKNFGLYPKIELSVLIKNIAIENQKLGEKDNQSSIVFVNEPTVKSSVEELEGNAFDDIIQKEIEKLTIETLTKIKNTKIIDIDECESELQLIKKQEFENKDIKTLIDKVVLKISKQKDITKLALEKLQDIEKAEIINFEKWNIVLQEVKSLNIDFSNLSPILETVEKKVAEANEIEKQTISFLNEVQENSKFTIDQFNKWTEKFENINKYEFGNQSTNEHIKDIEITLQNRKKLVDNKLAENLESKESKEEVKKEDGDNKKEIMGLFDFFPKPNKTKKP